MEDLHSGLTELNVKLKKPYTIDAWENLYTHENETELMNTAPAPILSTLFDFNKQLMDPNLCFFLIVCNRVIVKEALE